MAEENLSTELRPRIQVIRGVPLTTSLAVAEHFEKEHRDVLRAIRNEIDAHADPAFTSQHFIEAEHISSRGRPVPIFRLSEIGFSLVAMGFTGTRAKRWQRAYAQTFAVMRQQLMDSSDERTRQLFHESTVWRSKAMVGEMQLKALQETNEKLRRDMQEWRREIAVTRVERMTTEDLLRKEYGADAAQALGKLSEELSHAVIDALLSKEHHEEELRIARYAQGRPEPDRFCASEIFVRLLMALKHRLYSALLIWALLHLRALDTPVRIVSKRLHQDRQLKPRSVSMRAITDTLGKGFSRDMLYQHAIRLEAEGLIHISHDLDRRSRRQRKVMHYQICLQALLERLESVERSALLSITGTRTDIVLGSQAGLKNTPMLLLDEYEGYVGSRSLNLFYSEKQEFDDGE
ncbi:hypothetical protein EII20_10800 [Comamonadaceae bacterium OH2545_COT-014]|nr:hypothetical protein EII20_10800 [Comamonadaceae bacterium OH2545_COT-014]